MKKVRNRTERGEERFSPDVYHDLLCRDRFNTILKISLRKKKQINGNFIVKIYKKNNRTALLFGNRAMTIHEHNTITSIRRVLIPTKKLI